MFYVDTRQWDCMVISSREYFKKRKQLKDDGWIICSISSKKRKIILKKENAQHKRIVKKTKEYHKKMRMKKMDSLVREPDKSRKEKEIVEPDHKWWEDKF